MATIEELVCIVGQCNEIAKRVGNGSLDSKSVKYGLQMIIEKKTIFKIPPTYSLPTWYVQPEQQIRIVTEFLKQHGGGNGFKPADIPPVPTNFVPHTPTAVLMLVVNFRSLQNTFNAWWNFITPPPGGYSKWGLELLMSDSKQLRFLPGINYPAGIYWVEFDPNTNQGKSPKSCWNDPSVAQKLASFHILIAAALFPDWVASWDRRKSPYPNMAGYQFKLKKTAWQYCPYLYRLDLADDGRQLRLLVELAYIANYGWSSPSVREC